MPTQIPTSFQRFTFSDEERVVAKTFNPLQLMWLQNLRGEAAEEKISLKYDPNNPLEYVQIEAALAARLVLLDELIGDK